MNNDEADRNRLPWRQRGQARPAWALKPGPGQGSFRDCPAFYPDRLECHVDGKRVRHEAGDYYGGWITAEIAEPFKGEPGTSGW